MQTQRSDRNKIGILYRNFVSYLENDFDSPDKTQADVVSVDKRREEHTRERAVASVMMKLVAKRTPDWYAKALRVYLMLEKEINAAREDDERSARREETIMLIEEELAAFQGRQVIQKIRLMRTVIGMLRRDADSANRACVLT